jgi:hypothetical protein
MNDDFITGRLNEICHLVFELHHNEMHIDLAKIFEFAQA